MENYVWLAIAAALSLAIFLIWVWRGDRKLNSSGTGLEEPIGVLVETAPSPPVIGTDQPSA